MKLGVVTVLTGESANETFYLANDQSMIIGRGSDADIHLADSYVYVGRRHCVIAYDGERRKFYVNDMSQGGVFDAHGKRINQEAYFDVGDKIALSDKGCIVQFTETEYDEGNIPIIVDSDETISVRRYVLDQVNKKEEAVDHKRPDPDAEYRTSMVTVTDTGDAEKAGKKRKGLPIAVIIGVVVAVIAVLIGVMLFVSNNTSENNNETEETQEETQEEETESDSDT